MSRLRKFLYLLPGAQRRRAIVVTALIALMAGLEMLGVASVFPFLNVLGNPESLETNRWLAGLYAFSGVGSREDFLVVLAAAAFVFIAGSAAARIYTQYTINDFAQKQRHALGLRLFRRYLGQPYAFFLNRHSSDLARSILSEVDLAVTQFIKPLMDMIAHGLVAIVLIALLFVVNPLVALITIVVIGGFYAIVFAIVRRKLEKLAIARLEGNRSRYRVASDAVASIKLVKLHGQEDVCADRFDRPSSTMAHSVAVTQTLSQVPRYVVETLAIGGVLVVFLVITLAAGEEGAAPVGVVLPLLGLYAFAGYRILPSVQSVYAAVSTMRMGGPSLDEVVADLSRPAKPESEKSGNRMPVQTGIELRNVDFCYEGSAEAVLRDVNVVIRPGERIGIRGQTGAGKSTLLDLLLGLLTPTRGQLLVDGQPIDAHNRREWQANLAYVPQDIVLLDDSIAANIAFAAEAGQVDQELAERAARQALIHDFIHNRLPEGYATPVGERGARLSGGQRQRIGIARALYREPKVLVLDEATSALDSDTETALLDNLAALPAGITVILVSHRQKALDSCGRVLEVEGGGVHVAEALPGNSASL